MAYPGVFNFPEMPQGDTFQRLRFTFPFPLVGFKVDMWIEDGFSAEPLKKFSTEDGSLTIEEDVVWIERFELDFAPGTHRYDIQLESPEGVKTTFIKGLFPIVSDVTKI